MTELRSRIPLALRGGGEPRPCTSRKCVGTKPAQTGEQGTGTLFPREQTWENACDAVLSECESTRPLNPQTQPVPGANLLQDLFQQNRPEWTLADRSVDGPVVSGGVLHLSWAPLNSSWKSCTPACSLGVVLSLLSRAICIALFLGSVHFEAMLETAPCRWNRVVEGCAHGLMQSNQREILGIVFYALRNWHSGFRGLVVGIAGGSCAAITRVGSGSVPLWGGASCVVLTEWGGKNSLRI